MSAPHSAETVTTRPVAVGLDYDTDAPWLHVHKDDDRAALESDWADAGGWFVRDVPAELVDRFDQAMAAVDAAVTAIHNAAGYDSSMSRMREVCDRYQGDSATFNGRTFWDDCDGCGWHRDDHNDGSAS